MATLTCYVPTNTFGSAQTLSFSFPFGDGSGFELDFQRYYELFGGGPFTYPNGIPKGLVDTISVYNYSDTLTQFWNADGGLYQASAIFNILDSGTQRQFFEYIFYLNDTIYGSFGNDKLNGYRGNDFIDGYQGNDKLKGGKGFDSFFFALFDGRDVILDFSWKRDTIVLDSSLANDVGDISAYVYRRGVVLDFGSDEIRIQGLKLSKLDNVDFDFVA